MGEVEQKPKGKQITGDNWNALSKQTSRNCPIIVQHLGAHTVNIAPVTRETKLLCNSMPQRGFIVFLRTKGNEEMPTHQLCFATKLKGRLLMLLPLDVAFVDALSRRF